ncbi:mitochondrial carrier [Cenococcum geophilum 1.58]|uniref:Mitochondrial carrier n=1 Tax=Cenococcum geophilum 1.58 TaxID=794803 RepID=A0ACC8EM27_9PEZI|nr:mitochondrial carrier [Cenococcum geophilum 1.58]
MATNLGSGATHGMRLKSDVHKPDGSPNANAPLLFFFYDPFARPLFHTAFIVARKTRRQRRKLAESTHAAPASTAARRSDNVAHALAGAGGLLSMALTYPLISTRAQVESKRAHSSTLNAAKRIIQREGIPGLYAGLDSALFGISVANFVYYYCAAGYEWSRAWFEKAALKAGRASKKLTTIESMLAGALAGSATVIITNLTWVVNTRMTARGADCESDLPPPGGKPAKKSSTLGTLLSIIRDEGRQRCSRHTVFEQLKNMLEKKRRVTPTDAFYLGALGKLLATSITYPYITVKSRMHVAGKDGPKEDMFATFKRVIREEGWTVWCSGIGPKATQSVITAAFLFAFKDVLYDMTVKARKKVALKAR